MTPELHFYKLTSFIENSRNNHLPGSQAYEDWDAVLDKVYEYEELVKEGFRQAA